MDDMGLWYDVNEEGIREDEAGVDNRFDAYHP